jgi:hypothetical protein
MTATQQQQQQQHQLLAASHLLIMIQLQVQQLAGYWLSQNYAGG